MKIIPKIKNDKKFSGWWYNRDLDGRGIEF